MKTTGSKRIAERYVRALFDVAQAASALDQVEADMRNLRQALDSNGDFQQFLSNPLVPRDHQADIMMSVADKLRANALTGRFLALLAHQKRLDILPAIIDLFLQALATARGEMTAEVTAAAPLKPKDIAAIGDRLSRAYGKKVSVETAQNPELLGGLVLRIGSVQLDGSLAGKLERLGAKLKAA